jgi:hypothetical protein
MEASETSPREFPDKLWRLQKEDSLQFLDHAFRFLLQEDHMWCKHTELIGELLIFFEKIQYLPVKKLLRKMHRQMRTCTLWFDVSSSIIKIS